MKNLSLSIKWNTIVFACRKKKFKACILNSGKKAKQFLIAFLLSYLVERGFSVVTDLFIEKRNAFDIVERCDLRLQLVTIEPDVIMKLIKDRRIYPLH